MPIHNQLCGLAVLVMILYMFLQQKRIGLYTEKIFLRTLLLSMLCIILDFVSIIAIWYRDRISQGLLDFICKSYVASIVLVQYLVLTYVMTDLYTEQEYYRKIRVPTAIMVLEALVVYILPIRYHVNGSEIYTEGPSVQITYVFALAFLVVSIGTILYCKDRIEYRRRLATLVWMGIWIVAAVVQFLRNEWLLVGFAGSLGILALYCILENPENNIDHKLGCFHTHALTSYLNQCFGRGEAKSILFLSINDRSKKDVDMEPVDTYLHMLIDWFRGKDDVMIFKHMDQELAFVFSDMSSMSHYFSKLQETFYFDQFYNLERRSGGGQEGESFPETLFILFPDTSMVRDTDELMMIHQALYVENCSRAESLVCYVNQQTLEKIRRESEIVHEIQSALEEDRVEVFYQPIYNVSEQKFSSAEALVRIRYPDGTLLSPGEFIPVAEANGLIDRLGERVFEKVCAFLKNHDPGELGIHYLEVNLSVVQCGQRNLADRYLEIMRNYGTNPWYINLEITETGTVLSKKTLLGNMNRLIREGVTFSLDDFGNGQSNLDYMIDMPVSVMKLDMNMTRAYFVDMKARMVVQSAIRMAHDLDLFIVAEGVETKEQFDEMVNRKVDYIQGYYFSKPLPEQEYLAFLQTRRVKAL